VAGESGTDAGTAKEDKRYAAKEQTLICVKDILRETGLVLPRPGFSFYAT